MGVDDKGTCVPLIVFVLVLACLGYNFKFVYGGQTLGVGCIEQEREALLSFRQSLIDDYGRLSSWGSQDECCEWRGVGCSNSTGRVTSLQLGAEWSSDDIYGHPLRGKINSALLELHHLTSLDLSWNDFGGVQIPEFIDSIKTLQHLYLYSSNFSGSIPVHLGNLTNLRTLDLSRNPHLYSDNLHWLSHLSLLSDLVLSYSKISDANWAQHVLMLPSLQELHLIRCMLPDVAKSLFVYNSSSCTSSLSVLSLPHNDLSSSTFDWLLNVSSSFVTFDSLESLDLSGNMLQGGIPKSLGNLSHLVSLDLSNAQLTGSVPTYLGQFSKLEYLDLSYNSFEGIISEAHFFRLHNLVTLRLSFNSLTLNLSPSWIPPFRLKDVRLASCKVGPSFPTWFHTQRNVTWVDLSSNIISDEVPKWFWNLSTHLYYFNLSHNQMSGSIPDLSSSPVRVIDLSFNKFSGPIPKLSSRSFVLQLSQNKFSGSISSICKISFNKFSLFIPIVLIDLSSNQLEGGLPNCWENMTELATLNLNNNNFTGEIPRSLGNLQNLKTLQLRGNDLSGELPSTLRNCQNLQVIDVGDNKISGNIRSWLSENFKNLMYLSLNRNRFYGGIPPEICQLNRMQILDLSSNNLSGKIPQCFNNFTSLVEENRPTTSSFRIIIPSGDDYIDYAIVQLKGYESVVKYSLAYFKLIDLSSNKLVGSIPKAFHSLRGLICLNLSRNSLTGSIDRDIGELKNLECLDLSRNHLTGEIPAGLGQLYFLSVLDLAYNDLLGKIPLGPQIPTFDKSAFAGNYGLCGEPLTLCPENDLRPSTPNEGEIIEEKDEGLLGLSFLQEFGIAMGFGFIVGLSGMIGSLILKSSWRRSYFKFVVAVADLLHGTTILFFTKFRRSL